MVRWNPAIVWLILLAVSACGEQVVEFPADGGADIGDHDAEPSDAEPSDAEPSDAEPSDANRAADANAVDDADASTAGDVHVVATTPVNGAVGVALATTMSATFDGPLDPQAISALTFTVQQGSTPVSGGVHYDEATTTVTFTPTEVLDGGLVYVCTIATGAKTPGSLGLATPHTWDFTTLATATAAPVVESVTPEQGALNVATTTVITATFGSSMAASTLNGQTFLLQQGASQVAGTVTFDAATDTATFKPDVALEPGLVVQASITTGVTDSKGSALAADYVWTFTTMTAACGQAQVALGAAGPFAVLAGATVTNTGATVVTGDLGVSPGSQVTGFLPGVVIGEIHAGDTAAALGIADLTKAYNDAAGRTLCPVSVAGNLGGMTLAPGLYKSTSSLSISSGDLTLDGQGASDAVFIFQVASTLTTTSGRQVLLINGAKASNVVWQVGTSATIGSTSAFVGTILADQAVTLETGATLQGRALARIAAVALDSNTVVKPAP